MTSRMVADSGITLQVRVQPKSSSDRLVVEETGRVRVAVTAAPVEDAANRAVCALLAKCLGLAKSNVRVKSGMHSRNKVILVNGLGEEEAMRRLSAH